MKPVLDISLAPVVAVRQRRAGHDAVHVRDRTMRTTVDEEIWVLAEREERTNRVSPDRFRHTARLAVTEREPSFGSPRRQGDTTPDNSASPLSALPSDIESGVEDSSVVVTADKRIGLLTLLTKEDDA